MKRLVIFLMLSCLICSSAIGLAEERLERTTNILTMREVEDMLSRSVSEVIEFFNQFGVKLEMVDEKDGLQVYSTGGKTLVFLGYTVTIRLGFIYDQGLSVIQVQFADELGVSTLGVPDKYTSEEAVGFVFRCLDLHNRILSLLMKENSISLTGNLIVETQAKENRYSYPRRNDKTDVQYLLDSLEVNNAYRLTGIVGNAEVSTVYRVSEDGGEYYAFSEINIVFYDSPEKVSHILLEEKEDCRQDVERENMITNDFVIIHP